MQNQSTPEGRAAVRKRNFSIITSLVAVGLIVTGGLYYLNRQSELKDQTTVEQTARVVITPSGFSPQTVKLAKGQQIEWVNQDAKAHRVASGSDGQTVFDSEESLSQQETYSTSIDEPGTYTFVSKENPIAFKGTLIVE